VEESGCVLIEILCLVFGARGSVTVLGTMLQVGRTRVRFSMRSLHFSIDLIVSSRTLVLGWNQSLTEMSTKNLPEGKE
jgi:hypothetical protein